MNHHLTRAYLHRFFSACKGGHQSDVPGIEFLYGYAVKGSWKALQDLQNAYPVGRAQNALRFLSDASAGVSATWFDRSEMLNGLTHVQWMEDQYLLAQVKSANHPSHLIVNKRGGSVLHFVASCGRYKPFKTLVADYKMDINLLNPKGRPHYCAHAERVKGAL